MRKGARMKNEKKALAVLPRLSFRGEERTEMEPNFKKQIRLLQLILFYNLKKLIDV